MDYHGDVAISIDIMKVNGIPFLVSISTMLDFVYTSELKDLTINTTVDAIGRMVKINKSRGFYIVGMAADNGFKVLETNKRYLALGIPINIASEDEHESFSERLIRSLKERTRMILSTVLLKKLMRRMIIKLVYSQVFCTT